MNLFVIFFLLLGLCTERHYSLLATLKCFDSQSATPIRLAQCEPEEVCYVEYYALNISTSRSSSKHKATHNNNHHPQLAHYFDRFCIHQRHCIVRGLWPGHRPCLNHTQLDAVVARTFEHKLRSERLDPKRLVHSHFCCCSDRDKCNELGPEELESLFNVSAIEEHEMSRRTRPRKGGGGSNAEKGRKSSKSNGYSGINSRTYWRIWSFANWLALLWLSIHQLILLI